MVLPGTLDENETAQKTGEIVEIVNEFGQNAEIKPLGKSRLAYPINQVRYGYFYTIHFESEPENVKTIEAKLRLTRGLLRSIVYLYNKASESAEKIAYFSQSSTLSDPSNIVKDEEATTSVSTDIAQEETKDKEISEEITDQITEHKEDQEEQVVEKKPKIIRGKEKKIDLKEIDKKLDEILSDEDINI